MIVDFIVQIFMDILPILQYILWLIIRVALLIFIWIMFALTLIIIVIGFLLILINVAIFSPFLNVNTSMNANSVTIQKQDLIITLGYEITMETSGLIGFVIPIVYFYFNKGNTTIKIPYSFSTTIDVPKFELSEDFYDFPDINQSQPSSSDSDSPESDLTLSQMIAGANFAMGLLGAGLGFTAVVIRGVDPNEFYQHLLAYVSIFLWAIGIFSLAMYVYTSNGLTDGFFIGLSIGFFFTGLVAALVANRWSTFTIPMSAITFALAGIILSITSKILGQVGKLVPDLNILFSLITGGFGLLGLILGAILLRTVGAGISIARDSVSICFMMIGFGLSLFFILAPIFLHIE